MARPVDGWTRRKLRPGTVVGVSLVVALLLSVAGFVLFVRLATEPASVPPRPADGIVALTGGADRVRTALRLLADGRGKHLLVSGIGGGADLEDLARRAGIDAERFAPRITLGRGAATTHDNAAETAAWARRDNIRSLIVVTAFYHMPRALVEIRRPQPAVRLYPYPVYPPDAWPLGRGEEWPRVRLMAGEYVKYLAALAGLTALLPARPPRLVPAAQREAHG